MRLQFLRRVWLVFLVYGVSVTFFLKYIWKGMAALLDINNSPSTLQIVVFCALGIYGAVAWAIGSLYIGAKLTDRLYPYE